MSQNTTQADIAALQQALQATERQAEIYRQETHRWKEEERKTEQRLLDDISRLSMEVSLRTQERDEARLLAVFPQPDHQSVKEWRGWAQEILTNANEGTFAIQLLETLVQRHRNTLLVDWQLVETIEQFLKSRKKHEPVLPHPTPVPPG
jgi:hypothetical protein